MTSTPTAGSQSFPPAVHEGIARIREQFKRDAADRARRQQEATERAQREREETAAAGRKSMQGAIDLMNRIKVSRARDRAT
ncbi:hypothetical protein [Oceanibaculum indicum]|uniref:Uncharacterized protein n=1 Tax=Oceanibaculum indicum TaxID=526216 RepID=A0A420WR02_9PROT|nr:hypothetical protein [Oceanibaculum indicum]RKQ73477.1 hypothetical protein BCL74_1266 [Oceanibaculum indicum]